VPADWLAPGKNAAESFRRALFPFFPLLFAVAQKDRRHKNVWISWSSAITSRAASSGRAERGKSGSILANRLTGGRFYVIA